MHDSDIILHGVSSEPPVPEATPCRGSGDRDRIALAPEYDSDESEDENVSILLTYPNRKKLMVCQGTIIGKLKQAPVPSASHSWLKRRRSLCEDDPESTAIQDSPCARRLRRVMVRGNLRGIAHDERRIG